MYKGLSGKYEKKIYINNYYKLKKDKIILSIMQELKFSMENLFQMEEEF